jgi:hypothetical protein
MGERAATAPWNTLSGRRRGRPSKDAGEASASPGCVWPEVEGTCRGQRERGLALCASHGKILSRGWGECAWPGCTQWSFHALCTYHDKCARGLIDGSR